MKNDADLKREVLVRLEFDRVLDVAGLGIAVRNGVVTLEGMVHDGQERAAAERAVKLVPGVKGVVDRIQVELPEPDSPSDAEIATAVADAIQWLTTVPPETIQVAVQDGWVTLKGRVDSHHQRETVENVVRHLPQTKGVKNLLRIEPNAGDWN
jgi:osmotically-inducible protein OsmY